MAKYNWRGKRGPKKVEWTTNPVERISTHTHPTTFTATENGTYTVDWRSMPITSSPNDSWTVTTSSTAVDTTAITNLFHEVRITADTMLMDPTIYQELRGLSADMAIIDEVA